LNDLNWIISAHIGATTTVPTVSLRRLKFTIEEIYFATSLAGSDFHYVYEESSSHSIAPGDLQGWGKGAKITDPEWTRSSGERHRTCFTRRKPIAMRVKIRANNPAAIRTPLRLRLWISPRLDGSRAYLKRSSKEFSFPTGVSETWVVIRTAGRLPNEIGRYILRLRWRLTSIDGRRQYHIRPRKTRNKIYGIYKQPLLPDYDSASDADAGSSTSRTQGTLTGTKKRFDHLMLIIGGNKRRFRVSSQAKIIDLFWKLHKGINDTPGAPPYFDAGHDKHLTHDGARRGTKIHVEDQWLAWVRTPSNGDPDPRKRHWNDASCIGHVQVLKTMAASIGLFARRTWIFPHTKMLPDGTTTTYDNTNDTDLYCLGNYDSSKIQTWNFTFTARTYRAVCKLMEPENSWENFEACLRSPNGKFLTGGYSTRSNPSWMRRNKGFNSAAQLMRWWSNTSRTRWHGRRIPRFRRFLAWVYRNRTTGEEHYWDVNGTHYNAADYGRIRDSGNKLPPP
jgi:hypothetical protein